MKKIKEIFLIISVVIIGVFVAKFNVSRKYEVISSNIKSRNFNIMVVSTNKEKNRETNGIIKNLSLLQVDKVNSKLKIKLISPDIYVTSNGYTDKISEIYNLFDISGVENALYDNFDVKVDGYIILDKYFFRQLMSLIGDIDVKLTNQEKNFFSNLNTADKILKYINYDKKTFIYRQQKIIKGIIDKIISDEKYRNNISLVIINLLKYTDYDIDMMLINEIAEVFNIDSSIEYDIIPKDLKYTNIDDKEVVLIDKDKVKNQFK